MAGTAERLEPEAKGEPARDRWLRVARPPLGRAALQGSLFGWRASGAAFDASFARLEHLDLGAGAWVDVVPGWLVRHERLFLELRETTDWHAHTRMMYERRVAVPRLTGAPALRGEGAALLEELARALSARYAHPLFEVSLALYRDGADSVALHGDHIEDPQDALVAILSLGSPRRFVMKRVQRSASGVPPPAGSGGVPAAASRFLRGPDRVSLTPAEGDLVVMGGSCQRTWLHGVPKVVKAGERIAVMFR